MGTVGYLSPEQVRGHGVGWESDVFSLGALLVFATTGRTPFGGGSVETVLYRTLHEEPDLAGVPAELRPVVRGCLDKEPGRRPTVETLLKHFGALAAVADRPRAARNPTPRRTVVDPARAAPVSAPSSAPAWVAALIVGALTYGQLWMFSTMWWQPAAVIAVVVTLLGVVVFRAARSASWPTEEDIGVVACCLLALACGIVALVELSKTNLLWWGVVLTAIGVVLALSFVTYLVIRMSTMDSCAGSVTTAGFASGCLAAALMGWSTEITPWLSLPLAFVISIATAKVLKPVLSSGLRRPALVGRHES